MVNCDRRITDIPSYVRTSETYTVSSHDTEQRILSPTEYTMVLVGAHAPNLTSAEADKSSPSLMVKLDKASLPEMNLSNMTTRHSSATEVGIPHSVSAPTLNAGLT